MLVRLDDHEPSFPPAGHAMDDAGGVLCSGGNLKVSTLLRAYSQGIFPWFNEEQPILWWSPDPRMVLFPERIHISKSMKKWLKKTTYAVSMNRDFVGVINACSDSDIRSGGTWITEDMKQAYIRLHKAGHAHSLEVWSGHELVGGLYGPAMGEVFFGESMFSKRTNASKMALIALARMYRCKMIDCQFHTDHLERMGAELISRKFYLALLQQWV